MKKLAIIGSGELQTPLILKAKNMGYETYVFSKRNNTLGEKECINFYDVDVLNINKILEICKEIKIDGITTIASDITTKAVVYVSEKMQLIGNNFNTLEKSTNKYKMRSAFKIAGLITPQNFLIDELSDINTINSKLNYPVIVKPVDRAGSAGVVKVNSVRNLKSSISYSMEASISKQVIVEEYIEGKEYSCECISINGNHKKLVFTEKFTTGSPNFVETGHIQPAKFEIEEMEIEKVIFRGLDALNIRNGASHVEFKITPNKEIVIIEIGARMGGDFIGSDLVPLSTGVDYIKLVIDIALNNQPVLPLVKLKDTCAIKFICNSKDYETLKILEEKYSSKIYSKSHNVKVDNIKISNSSDRYGWIILKNIDNEFAKRILNNEI